MTKTIWIVGGGVESIPGIRLAKKLGLNVVVSDGNPNAPGLKFADKSIIASTYDIEGTVNAAYEYHQNVNPIDAVICIATDVPLTVASIAEKLSLPGITTETARKCSDKFLMKETLLAAGIPIPWFSLVKSVSELCSIISERGFPLVIKPVDSRGSRGVIRINKNSDIDKAFDYSMNFSPSKKLILEKWLSGYQLSSESLVISGKTHLCGISDRNYSNLKNTFPYVIEDGGETPSRFYPKIKNELQKIMDVVAKAFEIKNGVLKGDIVLKNNRLYIIEIATRLSGGFWSTMSIPLVYRINLIEKAILLALGLKTKPPPKQLRHYCYEVNRYIFPNPGIIKNITKPPREKIPKYVTYLEVNAKVGDRVDAIINHPMRKGRIQVIGKTRNQCIKRVKKIRNLIKIKTNPD